MTRLLSGDSLTLDLAPEDPADLLARLRAVGVEMNASAEQLIADAWVRVDARFGSLYQRREAGPGLLV